MRSNMNLPPLDNEQIEVAVRSHLAPRGRPEQDDLVWLGRLDNTPDDIREHDAFDPACPGANAIIGSAHPSLPRGNKPTSGLGRVGWGADVSQSFCIILPAQADAAFPTVEVRGTEARERLALSERADGRRGHLLAPAGYTRIRAGLLAMCSQAGRFGPPMVRRLPSNADRRIRITLGRVRILPVLRSGWSK